VGFIILTVAATSSAGPRRPGPAFGVLVLAGIVAVVALFIVSVRRTTRAWPGYGPGATAGLVLGLMALGPCAACYLLSLG
jgi:hypothetical protein